MKPSIPIPASRVRVAFAVQVAGDSVLPVKNVVKLTRRALRNLRFLTGLKRPHRIAAWYQRHATSTASPFRAHLLREMAAARSAAAVENGHCESDHSEAILV